METDRPIKVLFERHGKVDSVKMINDRETGKPRGFGFVEMGSGEAQAAIQGLNAKVDAKVQAQAAALAERDARIERQAREIGAQRAELSALRDRLAQVESLRGELAAMQEVLATALSARTNVAAAVR